MADEMPPEAKAELDQIVAQTKKGFDLHARLHNRGLRKATITLFLDDDMGSKLGQVDDLVDIMGNVTGRLREGIMGRIEEIESLSEEERKKAPIAKELANLKDEREKLVAEMFKSAITVKMQAVPPIIQNDSRRKAKRDLEITEKDIPSEKAVEFNMAYTAHLLSVVIQSITDNETGAVNDEVDVQDAKELMDHLPPGQFSRLDQALNKVQFTDAISRSIEGQEDFS